MYSDGKFWSFLKVMDTTSDKHREKLSSKFLFTLPALWGGGTKTRQANKKNKKMADKKPHKQQKCSKCNLYKCMQN